MFQYGVNRFPRMHSLSTWMNNYIVYDQRRDCSTRMCNILGGKTCKETWKDRRCCTVWMNGWIALAFSICMARKFRGTQKCNRKKKISVCGFLYFLFFISCLSIVCWVSSLLALRCFCCWIQLVLSSWFISLSGESY